MNFTPARIEAADGALVVRAGEHAFALSPARAERHAGDGGREVLLGIRPEHMYRAEGEAPRPDLRAPHDDGRDRRAHGRQHPRQLPPGRDLDARAARRLRRRAAGGIHSRSTWT